MCSEDFMRCVSVNSSLYWCLCAILFRVVSWFHLSILFSRSTLEFVSWLSVRCHVYFSSSTSR
uniref:Putative ovule protein n=1 Tax=Solanum chacoense TaxID=4108 RepID=A0A0V0ICU3_SOLCH